MEEQIKYETYVIKSILAKNQFGLSRVNNRKARNSLCFDMMQVYYKIVPNFFRIIIY